MGLENGIYVKGIKKLPKRIHNGWADISADGEIELAYWRKCRGVRNKILETIGIGLQGGSTYKISRAELKEVIKVLKKFNDKKYWEDNANSIWEYDEFKDYQEKNIKQLKWLYIYMRWHKNIEVYFYDSY